MHVCADTKIQNIRMEPGQQGEQYGSDHNRVRNTLLHCFHLQSNYMRMGTHLKNIDLSDNFLCHLHMLYFPFI